MGIGTRENRSRKEQRRGNGRVKLDGCGREVDVLRPESLSQSQVWGSRGRLRFVAAVCLNLKLLSLMPGEDLWVMAIMLYLIFH